MENWKRRLYEGYVSTGQARVVNNKSSEPPQSNYYHLTDLIKKHLCKNLGIKILDLGCGHGSLIYALKTAGYKNIIGVDFSREQVNIAHSRGLTEVINKDLIMFLKEDTNNYDVVFLMDVLEHLDKNTMFDLLDWIYKKLNKNGTLIIHVPNADGLNGMRIRYGDLTHETCFNESSLSQILKACGFTSMNFYEDVPIIHGVNSFVRFILWKVLTLIPRIILIAETGYRNHILSQNILSIVKK